MAKKTNIEINGSNYFRVTATIGKDNSGKPIRKQFYGDSKKEAEAKRDEFILNLSKGLSINFDKALFGLAFKSWFDNVLRPSISLSSYNRYEMDYRIRIKDSSLSQMKLIDIKSIHIQGFYNDLLKSYTVNTVKLTHKLLNNFFNYCVRADLIIKSPMYAVELPKEEKTTATNKAISDTDIEKLVQAAKDDIENFIFIFAIFTGMRQGEILSLCHSDIDFAENTITVNKSVKFLTVDGVYQPVLSQTKTGYSTRTIPIMNEILAPLKAYIRYEKEKHLGLSIPFGANNTLFTSKACTYREAANIRKILIRLCRKIDIEETTFHSLRHTFCTLLAKNNVPLKTASELMGHSDIGITAKIYTHVDMDEKRKGIQKLSAYLEKF